MLDTLLVLGGETGKQERSRKAISVWSDYAFNGSARELEIIVSGNYTGFIGKPGEKAEATVMKEFLNRNHIPTSKIHEEAKSVDTVANFIYAWDILENLHSGDVGIVTDEYHMRRAMRLGERIYGDSFSLHAVPTNLGAEMKVKAKELIITYAILYDLNKLGVDAGDKNAFKQYLESCHPMHAPLAGNVPPQSMYERGIKIQRMLA
jgi:uncharacterized SAM-binding protein YcdF (DUF218 family)